MFSYPRSLRVLLSRLPRQWQWHRNLECVCVCVSVCDNDNNEMSIHLTSTRPFWDWSWKWKETIFFFFLISQIKYLGPQEKKKHVPNSPLILFWKFILIVLVRYLRIGSLKGPRPSLMITRVRLQYEFSHSLKMKPTGTC